MKEFGLPQKLFGIIGYPLGHSVSPILHNWAFQVNSLPYVYFPWPLSSHHLPEFILCLRTLPIHGLSVTIPHKQKIIPYLDDLTPQALSTMAVNTLYWEENHLWGDNTDCQGFINSLTMRGITPSSALILGAGGATLACLQGLKQLGTQDIFVTSRRKETVSALKQTSPHPFQSISWDERADIEVDMLINATPVGMAGLLMDQSPFPAKGLKNITYCYDLIYNPPQTQLLQQAQQKGCTTINGLDMFILQAQAQFSLWTGHHFPNSKAKQLITDCLTHL